MKSASEIKTIGTDFTDGAIMPHLWRFFVPFLLANLLNSLYNTVDTAIIGQFAGGTGIVAVTMGGKFLSLLTYLSTAFAGAGQIYIAQIVGAKAKKELKQTIGTLFTELFFLSLFLAVLVFAISKPALVWLNTPADSFDQALAYLRITTCGLPLLFGYNAVASVLRGMGDSKGPLIYISIATAVNIAGDLFFVAYLNMGAKGTAIATVLGQGVSLLCAVTSLYRRKTAFGFDFKLSSFRIEKSKLKILLALAWPVAIRVLFISSTQIIILGFVNLYGVSGAAAYSIGDKIYVITNNTTISAKQAAGGMMGQNVGADKPERVQKILKYTLMMTLGFSTVFSAVIVLFPYAVFGVFTQDATVFPYAPTFMWISALSLILSAIMAPYESVIIGTGKSILMFVSGLLDGVVFRMGFTMLFAYGFGMGLTGLFLGESLARLGPVIVGLWYYYSGAWRKAKKLTS